jgi:hypothetical protein
MNFYDHYSRLEGNIPGGNIPHPPPKPALIPTGQIPRAADATAVPGQGGLIRYQVIARLKYPSDFFLSGDVRTHVRTGVVGPVQTEEMDVFQEPGRTEYSSKVVTTSLRPEENGRRVSVRLELSGFSGGWKNDPVRMRKGPQGVPHADFEGPREQSAFIPIGQLHTFVFDLTYSPSPMECKGQYYVRLLVKVVGGRLGANQFRDHSQASAGELFTDKDGKDYYSPQPGVTLQQESPDLFSFTWPAIERDCGEYSVHASLKSDLPISPSSHSGKVEVRNGQTTKVEFTSTLDLSSGDGGGMPPKDQPAAESGEQQEEGHDAATDVPHSALRIGGAKAFLWGFGGNSAEPEGSSVYPLRAWKESLETTDIGDRKICTSQSPPWTLFDMQLDVENSEDAENSL